jgi:hypothetical protein
MMWRPYVTLNIDCKKIAHVPTIFGGLNVFSPCDASNFELFFMVKWSYMSIYYVWNY